ncbi:MAG: hypothetical protein N2C14_25905, partial [Planctomycetales bacterium]
LAAAHRLAQPRGTVGMILPRPFLNSSSTTALRNALAAARPPCVLHAPDGRGLFPFANVKVAAVVLAQGVPCVGGEALPLKRLDVVSSNWWKAVSSKSRGKDCSKEAGTPLGDLFEVAAGMTARIAYEIKPFLEDRSDVDWPRLVTAGLLDPFACRWGQATCRYLKRRYEHPVVRLDQRLSQGARKRITASRRPKVLVAGVAGPGNRVEAFVDEHGVYCGAVSTFAILHERNELEALRLVCRFLNSDAVRNAVDLELAAASMGNGMLTIRKDFLRRLTIPDALTLR